MVKVAMNKYFARWQVFLKEIEFKKLFLETNKEKKILDGDENLICNSGEINEAEASTIDKSYFSSNWYGEIAEYLKEETFKSERETKVQKAALVGNSNSYLLEGEYLFFVIEEKLRRCILKEGVAKIVMMDHDQGGHFSRAITLWKPKEDYWPRIAADVRDYVQGCLVCAKYGIGRISQTSAGVALSDPMELLGPSLK